MGLKYSLLALILIYTSFLHSGCIESSIKKDVFQVFCDAESVVTESGTTFFKSNGVDFRNGHTRVKKYSFSGDYSSRVTAEHRSGMGYSFYNIEAGEIFEASIWRLAGSSSASLIVSGDSGLFKGSGIPVETRNGWELLKLRYVMVGRARMDKISFYPWLPEGDDTVYFDDLSIRRLNDSNWIEPEIPKEVSTLDIYIDSLSLQRLQDKRKKALIKGILIRDKSDWASATVNWEGLPLQARLRLKGDWTDHLELMKWSFRIKIKGSNWNGMKTFSIQRPSTRNFLHEWVFHQLLKQEDILAPRYGFVFVRLNEASRGLFAYEEHFKKEMLHYYKRREGPILKFNEDQLWELRSKNSLKSDRNVPIFESSEIEMFSKSRPGQYEAAQNLMYQYKYALRPASDIFDVNLMAKYFALMDVSRAYHGNIWHNLRFYFNPVTCKLEPIGFDSYHESHIRFGSHQLMCFKKDRMFESLFGEKHFLDLYLAYLRQYSSVKFMKDFTNSIRSDLEKYEQYIKIENPEYSYDPEFLFGNIAFVRDQLKTINRDQLLVDKQASNKVSSHPATPFEYNDGYPIQTVSVAAYRESMDENWMSVSMVNYHYQTIEVIGSGNTFASNLLKTAISLPAYNCCQPPEVIGVTKLAKASNVFYKVSGQDSIFVQKIQNKKIPINYSPRQEIFENIKSSYILKGDKVVFNPGLHTVTKDIIIDASYQVIFEPGAVLDLIYGAKFLSLSPVYMEGTDRNPIIIKSSDGTAMGFTVLQAGKPSVLKNVQFNNLNTLNYKGWTLTGAVTFYESDVNIYNCSFTNSKCEDALNIIKSQFDLDNNSFSNSYSDAFDADYCTGKIANSTFSTVGNDGIDISGSSATITNCRISVCGDKAVSIGEESDIVIESIVIDNAVTGIAVKDWSEVIIRDITLSNCNYGFMAFKKKTSFGPAIISVEKLTKENVKELGMIEMGSVMEINEVTP